MRSKTWFAILATVSLLAGMLLSNLLSSTAAVAQSAGPTTPGRYQLSAHAGTTPEGVAHGCYILDTATGQLWHARLGGSPERVSNQLP